ncbi:MAG TPA: acetolactate synthase small subunit [Candidatus Limiplasma sp.]|nr:acetolactate synthase small subunit [Candidatus Limiplasma sp.]
MKKLVLGLLVNNEAGVLTRVSGLFARRGFNISSLSVGETQNPLLSRITIQALGDEYVRTQLVQQLRKLHDVKVVENMELEQTICRELMLIKVSAGSKTRSQVLEGANVFRAKVCDLTPTTVTMELTGTTDKLDAFITFLEPFDIIETCRTGITAIGRGEYMLKENEEVVTHG